jgi:hypothetical protein
MLSGSFGILVSPFRFRLPKIQRRLFAAGGVRYGAFSVAPGGLPALIAYVDNQEDHHRTRTFQDENYAFLDKYGIEFDERYVWD